MRLVTSSVLVLILCAPCLAEPIAIGGRVMADGHPAEGAKVSLIPGLGRYGTAKLRLEGQAGPAAEVETLTDAAGRFRLEAPRDGLWKVHVALDGWVPRELRLAPLLHATELGAIELTSDAELKVRLTAGDPSSSGGGSTIPDAARVVGYPIDPAMSRMSGRRVPLAEASGWRRPRFTGTADERGSLRLPASGDEKIWVLEVAAEGFVPQVVETPVRRSIELALRPGIRREIETVDAAGEPLVGVLLFLEDGYLPLAMSDGRGRAPLVAPADAPLTLIAFDPSGRYGWLRLEPPEAAADERVATRSSSPQATFTLDDPRTIRGRVVDQESREPIAGALVWAGTTETARTDAGGGYSLRLPPPWSGGSRGIPVQAAAPGYVSRWEPVAPAGPIGPTLALGPAAGLGGRVFDVDQKALAGVEIDVSVVARERRRARPDRWQKRQARTGDDGRFEVRGLVAGQAYRLRLVKAGFAPGKLEVEALKPFEQRAGLEAVLHRGRRAVGLVVDEQELPVAGAVVRLEEASDPRRRRLRRFGTTAPPPQDTTGVDGGFQIPDLAAGGYDLKVESPGFGPVKVPGIEVPEGAGDVDLGTVVLSPGVAIEGLVVDAEGRPLAGIEIRAGEPSRFPLPAAFQLMMLARETPAITGADGRFAVPDRRQGERLDLVVSGDGYVTLAVAGVTAPPEEPLEVVLKQSSRVSGRVVDPRGEPIAGASVEARAEGLGGSGGGGMSSLNRSRTDADGGFELRAVEPGLVTVAASATGFQEAQLSGLEAAAGGELRDVELVLRPGAMVRGTVLDAGGEPVAGARVWISATGEERPEAYATTDGDGRFEITGVRPGRRTVTASDDRGRQVAKSLEVATGGQSVELRFADGVEVSGRVVDAAGLGVAGAEVSLEPSARDGWRRSSPEAASVDDGSFTIPGVMPGSYHLSAAKEGFARARLEAPVEVSTRAIGGLEIRLDEGVRLSGRILGLELDDLAQVEVRAGRSSGRVDFEGGYRVDNLAPGEVVVSASIPGSGRQVTRRITVEAGAGEMLLDLEFGSGHLLSGTVLAGDQPVSGAMVRLSGTTVRTSGSATTDSQGRFQIEGLDAGGYTLWVRSWDSGAAHTESLELLDDDDVLVQLGAGRVAGQVRDRADGEAIEGVRLSLVSRGEEASSRRFGGRSATSDAHGRFSFAAVPEGGWWLRATKAGYADAEIALETLAGDAASGVDVLLAATAGLSFEVVTAAGVPPSGVEVSLLDNSGRWVAGGRYTTLQGGRVEITTVPDGRWEMLVVAGGSAVADLWVTAPGDAGRIQLSPGGTVRVEVPDLADGSVAAGLVITGSDGRQHRGVTRGGGGVATYALRAGRVTIPNLTPGTWTFTVTAGARSWSADVVVTPGEPVEVTLQ